LSQRKITDSENLIGKKISQCRLDLDRVERGSKILVTGLDVKYMKKMVFWGSLIFYEWESSAAFFGVPLQRFATALSVGLGVGLASL
jgi:uncharacterized membrane protein